MSAIWYYHRLRAMGPEEILHRIRLHEKKRKWRRGADAAWTPDGLKLDVRKRIDLTDIPAEPAAAVIAEASRYLDRHWLFFGLDMKEENINWHADPVSGRQAQKIFGFDINHRDASAIGDIKVIWEKNRHHHLSVLSAAYALTDDERYSDEVARQIFSWIEQNPLFIGVNWTHPLEQGIRLISWVWCERLLRGSNAHDCLFAAGSPVLRSIYQQQRFVAETHCCGSSANNHLIGEMAGLYVSCKHFPLGPEAEKWRLLGKRILEEELVRQTFASGLNREQAFSYHLFVLAFGLLALAESEDFDGSAKEMLRKMLAVVPALADVGGNLPRYGDADDGKVLQLAALHERPSEWLLDLGGRMLGLGLTRQRTLTADLICRGLSVESGKHRDLPAPVGSRAFEDAGIYELVSGCNTENEVFVLADAGPLGYLSIAAHGHADALSFTLSAGGLEFLVDPGTYTYYADPVWREYFRGTAAHNTITVDGRDQSEQAGPMMWRHHARTTVLQWMPTPAGGVLRALHDGYRRAGVTHERRFELNGNRFLIRDTLTGRGVHHVELRFHLHPACAVEMTDSSTAMITRQGRILRISLPPAMPAKILHAESFGGWYSAGFMMKEPAFTVSAAADLKLPVEVQTEIEVLNEN